MKIDEFYGFVDSLGFSDDDVKAAKDFMLSSESMAVKLDFWEVLYDFNQPLIQKLLVDKEITQVLEQYTKQAIIENRQDVIVGIKLALGRKCQRCYLRSPSVGEHFVFRHLCKKCTRVVEILLETKKITIEQLNPTEEEKTRWEKYLLQRREQ